MQKFRLIGYWKPYDNTIFELYVTLKIILGVAVDIRYGHEDTEFNQLDFMCE